jgi:hypothetical protein
MKFDVTPIVDALNRLAAAPHKDWWDKTSAIVLFATLLVLCIYTYLTHQLRKAAQRQNEISVMPMFTINQVSPNGLNRPIVIRNVGRGAAFNMSVDCSQPTDGKLLVEHEGNVMVVGQRKTLSFDCQKQGNPNAFDDADEVYNAMNSGTLPDPLDLIVRCRSISSLDYAFHFRFTLGAGRLKITFEGMKPAI